MSSMDRARVFLKGRAKQIALTIVPLALAAMNAQAGVILNTSLNVGSGIFDGVFTTVGSITTSQLAPAGGVTGVKGWGEGTTTSSGGGFLQMIMGGTSSGTLDASTIVDFTTLFSASEVIVPQLTQSIVIGNSFIYSLTGNIFFSNSALNIGTTGPQGSFVTSISNQLLGIQLDLSSRAGLEPTGWSSILTVCLDSGLGTCAVGGPQLTLEVPQNSMDITGVGATGVPEPSAWLLLGSGLGGLLFLRKRRA